MRGVDQSSLRAPRIFPHVHAKRNPRAPSTATLHTQAGTLGEIIRAWWEAMPTLRFRRSAVLAGLCLPVFSLFVLIRRGDHGLVSSHGFGAERARRVLRGEGWGELAAAGGEGSVLSRSFRRRASTPRAPPGHPYFTDDEDVILEAAAAADREEEPGGGHHAHYWHKPLHPIDVWDVTGVGLACIGLMIAAAGGIGGGGILVPLYILVLGFDPKHAIPLSNITIFGGAITNTVLNLSKRHPDADRPLVDWDLILVMEPLTSKPNPLRGPLCRFCTRLSTHDCSPCWFICACEKCLVAPEDSPVLLYSNACMPIVPSLIADRSFYLPLPALSLYPASSVVLMGPGSWRRAGGELHQQGIP